MAEKMTKAELFNRIGIAVESLRDKPCEGDNIRAALRAVGVPEELIADGAFVSHVSGVGEFLFQSEPSVLGMTVQLEYAWERYEELIKR